MLPSMCAIAAGGTMARSGIPARSGGVAGTTARPRSTMARVSALQLAVPAVDPLLDELHPLLPAGATVLDPAHISFGYPWLAPEAALAVVDDVAAALAEEPAVDVTLLGPRRFAPDRAGRVTVWLDPRPTPPLRDLGRAIAAVARRPAAAITPPSSRARRPAGVDPTPVEEVVAPRLPLVTRLDRVDLHVQASGGWRHARSMPLRGARG
jgi:hypothetical protein